MANSIKYLTSIDMNLNPIINFTFENLPSNPTAIIEGRYYYNTTTHKGMYYNGSGWKEIGDTYILPTATNTVLGGIKSGEDITINANGNVTIENNSHYHVSENISNLEPTVKSYPLNDFATPTADISFGGNKLIHLDDGVNSTDAITKNQLDLAINGLAGGLLYKGIIPTNTIPNDAKKGWFYKIGVDGTYYGIVCNVGDMLIVNNDLIATATSVDLDKIDNTESLDIVRLDSIQTFTNKTIDANNNTITNLNKNNFVPNALSEKIIGTNPLLATTNNVCIWTFIHNKNTRDIIISIRRIFDNAIMMASYVATELNSINIYFDSNVEIPENTYSITII